MPREWEGDKKLNLPVILGIIIAIVVVAVGVLLLAGRGGPAKLEASFTYTPASPSAGSPVHFTDTSTGDNIVSWSWNFGDGSTSTEQNPTHQFAEGTYNVTLTVETGDGRTATFTKSITVTGGGPAVETILVFGDEGLLPETGLMVDAFVWPQEGDHPWVTQQPLVNGSYTGVSGIPEGVSCWYTRNGPEAQAYAGWGVFIGVNPNTHQIDPTATHTIDLSGLSALEFYVKSPINLHVELQDWNPTIDNKGVKSQYLWIGNYGWENTGGWEKITIPKSDIRNVDFSHIWCPFMISTSANSPLVEWYVDWVQWVK